MTPSRTAARITPEYRPTHSNSLTTGKTVDYVVHFERFGLVRDILSFLIGLSTELTDYVGYEGLLAQTIPVSIDTKTESYRGGGEGTTGRVGGGAGRTDRGTREAAGPVWIEKLAAEARSSMLNRRWSHKVDEKAAGEVAEFISRWRNFEGQYLSPHAMTS
jgi:hypothetical protein